MEPTRYRIRVRGELGPEWSAWFEDLDVTAEPDGDTTLTGDLPDQAALHGLLARVRDLGLPLLSVESVEPAGSVEAPGAADSNRHLATE